MKVAVVGSRNLNVDSIIKDYIPENTEEIVSGGAGGADACAKRYALENNIKYTEFLPDYRHYRRGAPFKRNEKIADYSDIVLAFWNGVSSGTEYTLKYCIKNKIPFIIVIVT